MKSQSIKQRNKQKKNKQTNQKEKTPRTFEDIGRSANLWPQKRLSPFFIAFPLTENNAPINVMPAGGEAGHGVGI